MADVSLISDNPDPRLRYLLVEQIEANPFQPRQTFDEEQMAKLVASLKAVGVLQTVLVRPFESGFQIIAGERRWRAAKEAGFKTIPCMVREVDDATMILLSDEENENRVMITDRDRALRLQKLWEAWEVEGKKPSLRKVAAFLRQDKSWVDARLKTLHFHEDVIGLLGRQENVLSISKTINEVPDRDRRARYIAVLDAGGSAGDVHTLMAQDAQQDAEHAQRAEEHKQALVAIKEAQTPPDRFTEQTQRFMEATGNGISYSRGMVPTTSDNAKNAPGELRAAVLSIESWAPYVSDEELARILEPALNLVKSRQP